MAALFFATVLASGLFGDWPLLLFIGRLMGIGVGKTRFGNACALLSPNLAFMMVGRESPAVDGEAMALAFTLLLITMLVASVWFGLREAGLRSREVLVSSVEALSIRSCCGGMRPRN